MPKRPLRLSALLGFGLLLCSLPAQTPAEPIPGTQAAEPVATPVETTVAPEAIHSATQIVDSIAALKSKLFSAAPGDTIIVKNGVYTTSAALTVRCQGTAEKPITITAESVGGVELAGAGGFNVVEPAEHVIISGFKFTHAAGKNTIAVGTSQVRFTRNTFQCPGTGPYLSVLGDDAQIDYNEFGNKQAAGAMIAVGGVGSQVARRLWIHHNYFHDFAGAGGSDGEMLRFGLSALSASIGNGLVEHNLFTGCRGSIELISNRSSGNTYRYNTLLDSPSSQFTLRQGNDCLVQGNILRNTEGLRIFGDRHRIFSNYFEGNYMGINLGNGDVENAAGTTGSVHDRPDDCIIAFNTFVDNRTHYQLSPRGSGALGATNTTFANNILSGGSVGAKIDGPYTGAVWQNNLLWNPTSIGALPPEAYATANPRLTTAPEGAKHLQADSPAIAAALGDFPTVAFDLDGQPRPEKKSIGADEPSTAPITARFLTTADVGPAAK
jgi:hypothetical protein